MKVIYKKHKFHISKLKDNLQLRIVDGGSLVEDREPEVVNQAFMELAGYNGKFDELENHEKIREASKIISSSNEKLKMMKLAENPNAIDGTEGTILLKYLVI